MIRLVVFAAVAAMVYVIVKRYTPEFAAFSELFAVVAVLLFLLPDEGTDIRELTADGETLTETAHVYKDGVEVTDLSGYSFSWNAETATGDELLGTAQTQAITTADVDNVLKLRVDVYKDGTKLASGFDEVTDFSDPYYVNLKITGITGNAVRTGETATITPVAVKRSSGEEQPSLVTEWTFAIKDNKGAAFILTGKQAATFNGASCQVTYADMERAGMGLTGYVTGTF